MQALFECKSRTTQIHLRSTSGVGGIYFLRQIWKGAGSADLEKERREEELVPINVELTEVDARTQLLRFHEESSALGAYRKRFVF